MSLAYDLLDFSIMSPFCLTQVYLAARYENDVTAPQIYIGCIDVIELSKNHTVILDI